MQQPPRLDPEPRRWLPDESPDMPPRMRTFRCAILTVVAAAALSFGCKKRSPDAAPSAKKREPEAPKKAPPRCQELIPGSMLTVGDVGRPKSSGEPDASADDPDLPFAVEMGQAVSHAHSFVVSALRAKGEGTMAVIAVVPQTGRGGRVLELGATHGDVEPPRLASRGAHLVAAVPDSDAGGGVLRMASLTLGGSLGVTWGGEISEGRDASKVFDVELSKQRGVVVWDELDKKNDRSVISLASFAPKDLGAISPSRRVSSPDEDAEAPQLASRPGGFWLSWLSRAPIEKDAKKEKAVPTSGDDPLIAFGARRLMLARLDANGSLTGAPIAVSAGPSHVLVYDLASNADGSALLAWRDDPTSPGVEGRAVHFARVDGAGSVSRSAVQDESIGAGVPSLVVDSAAPKAGSATWLSLASVTDETQVAALTTSGKIRDRLEAEPSIRSAEPLAARAGRILIGRPRGLAVELSVLRCSPGASLPTLPKDPFAEK